MPVPTRQPFLNIPEFIHDAGHIEDITLEPLDEPWQVLPSHSAARDAPPDACSRVFAALPTLHDPIPSNTVTNKSRTGCGSKPGLGGPTWKVVRYMVDQFRPILKWQRAKAAVQEGLRSPRRWQLEVPFPNDP